MPQVIIVMPDAFAVAVPSSAPQAVTSVLLTLNVKFASSSTFSDVSPLQLVESSVIVTP